MAYVLIADDDPDNRNLLKIRLEAIGHEVMEATDGEDGLRRAQRQKPDLVILDVMMPKIDGWELCRRLRADPKTHTTPIIMLTACSQDIEQLRGWESGADEYLTKPWDAEKLMQAITRLLPSAASGVQTNT
ncbi:MAG: response regulator [Elusimicrobiota bacterium]|jgi:DNA-binding response OmpR family regulator